MFHRYLEMLTGSDQVQVLIPAWSFPSDNVKLLQDNSWVAWNLTDSCFTTVHWAGY